MPIKIPPIKVIAKVDPKLAEMVREMHRLKRVPSEVKKSSKKQVQPMLNFFNMATFALFLHKPAAHTVSH